jgi:hypothetical protein
MGRDPIQEAGGVNLTRFSRNRAQCLFDALGLEEQGAPDFRSICEMAAKLRVEIDKLPSSNIKRLFFETQHCILAKLCHGNCCLKLSDADWLTKTVKDFMDPAFEALAEKGNPRWRDTFLDVERWHLQAATSVGVLEDTGGAGETGGVAMAYFFNDWLTKMFAARHMALTHVDQDLRQALKKNGIGTDSEWRCIGRQVSECEKVSFNKIERSISWVGGMILSPSFDISKFRDGMRNDQKPPQLVPYGYGQGGAW